MNENIKKLAQISEENPELEVLFFANETMFYECCFWSFAGAIDDIQVKEYTLFFGDGNYVFEEDFEEYFEEEAMSNLYDSGIIDGEEDCDDYVKKFIDKLRKDGEIKKAIIVYLNVA